MNLNDNNGIAGMFSAMLPQKEDDSNVVNGKPSVPRIEAGRV